MDDVSAQTHMKQLKKIHYRLQIISGTLIAILLVMLFKF